MVFTKIQIQEAAARLFRKKGYSATSMRDIAAVVDIKAASIYNHFKSKQELLQHLLLGIAQLFQKGMAEIKESSLSPIEKLERLIALHVRLTVEHTDAIALIAGEWVHLENPVATEYIAIRDAYEADFKSIIEAGKSTGVIKDHDTEIILFSILSTMRWLYTWYSKNKNYNQVELERQMIDCLLMGVKK